MNELLVYAGGFKGNTGLDAIDVYNTTRFDTPNDIVVPRWCPSKHAGRAPLPGCRRALSSQLAAVRTCARADACYRVLVLAAAAGRGHTPK